MALVGLPRPCRCLPDGDPCVVGIADLFVVGGGDGLLWRLRMGSACDTGCAKPHQIAALLGVLHAQRKGAALVGQASCMPPRALVDGPHTRSRFPVLWRPCTSSRRLPTTSGKTPFTHCRSSSIWHCKPCARVSRSLPGTRLYVSSRWAMARPIAQTDGAVNQACLSGARLACAPGLQTGTIRHAALWPWHWPP